MTERTTSAETCGARRRRAGARPLRFTGPVDSRASVEAIRLTSSLSWRSRVAAPVRSNIRQTCRRDGGRLARRRARRLAPPRRHRRQARLPTPPIWQQQQVDAVRSTRRRPRIAAVEYVGADLVQQPIHRRAAVVVELDPHRRGGGLQRDPIRSGSSGTMAPIRAPDASTVRAARCKAASLLPAISIGGEASEGSP